MNIAISPSRRTLLKLAVLIAIGGTVPLRLRSGAALAQAEGGSEDNLALLIKGLYPHDFPDSVFDRVIASIEEAIASSPENSELVDSGLASLGASMAGQDLDQAQFEEALAAITGEPFFGVVKSQAIHFIYSDPEVWELIGFGGSSIEHGGYINRGFNDIDWLPEAE